MQWRFVVDLPDDAVSIMSDGIGQTIAVAKRFFAPISQQPYGSRNLCTDRTHLPEAGRPFSKRGCMLAGQFIDEANTRVAVGQSQIFNELGHVSTEQMRRSFVCASTGSKSGKPLAPKTGVVVAQGSQRHACRLCL